MNLTFLQDLSFLEKLYEQDFLEQYVKIISFNLNNEPQEELIGNATAGSINIDGASSLRRTCQLTLQCNEDQIVTDAYWGLRTIFKVYIGLKNSVDLQYDDICWFPQGTFVIQQFSSQYNESGLSVNLTGKDKMCLLNGELGGNLPVTIDFTNLGGLGDLKENALIYDIIRETVHVWGNEPYYNIIINDISQRALNILEYRVDGIQLKIEENNNYYQVNFTEESRDPLNNIYGYGDTVGYQLTDFVYPGEKTAAAGQPITTGILDPIVQLLGNYEYFYDIDGRFIFQEKRNYLNNSWSPMANNNKDILNGYMYLSPYSYEFKDAKLVSSYQNTPNLANIKNDFVVWGNKKTVSGSSIPIHMRLSIDDKPSEETIPGSYHPYLKSPGGWRHALYRMALDNAESSYKFYYADILEFWDQLFTVPSVEQIYVAIEKVYNEYKELDNRYSLASEIYEIYSDENKGRNNYIETLKYLSGYDNVTQEFWSYDLSCFNNSNLEENIEFLSEEIKTTIINFFKSNINEEINELKEKIKNYGEKYWNFVENIVKEWGPGSGENNPTMWTPIGSFWIRINAGLMGEEQKEDTEALFKSENGMSIEKYMSKYDYLFDPEVNNGEFERLNKYFKNNPLAEEKQLILSLLQQNIFYENASLLLSKIKSNWSPSLKIKNENYKDLNIQDIANPEDLIFWLDILDNDSEISQYKISKIGLRTKAVNDKDVTSISYRDIPTIIFKDKEHPIDENDVNLVSGNTVVNLPENYKRYFYISTIGTKTAYSLIEEYLYNYLYFANSVSLTTVPIPHLEPNTTIYIEEGKINIGGSYVINSISIPLASGEMSTISAVKSVERLY